MDVSVGNARIYFEVEGFKARAAGNRRVDVPTVLCLHGGPGLDHTTLRGFLSPLVEVAQLIYLDQRGNGRSDRSDPATWNLDCWAHDIERFCNELGLKNPVVFGHSFGAAVALAHATTFPERPAALVLSGTAGRIDRNAVATAFESLGGIIAGDAFRAHFDNPADASAERAFDTNCLPLYMAENTDATLRHIAIANEAVRTHYSTNEAFAFDFHPTVRSIVCPTLITAGSADPFCPTAELARFKSQFTNTEAHLHVFEGIGHAPYREATQLFLDLLVEFIDTAT